jgi:hypothetical protein
VKGEKFFQHIQVIFCRGAFNLKDSQLRGASAMVSQFFEFVRGRVVVELLPVQERDRARFGLISR